MAHVIMLRLRNTGIVVRNYRPFPSKEAAQNYIHILNNIFGKSSTVILSVQRY